MRLQVSVSYFYDPQYSSSYSLNDGSLQRNEHFHEVKVEALGDLKESPSLGESSHVMFSRMAKYSSLTAFYTLHFTSNSQKL